MLDSEVNRSQFQHIYMQGCPGPRDSSACPDRTPNRVGCVCRHHLTVVDHSHSYTFAQVKGLNPPAQRFPAYMRQAFPVFDLDSMSALVMALVASTERRAHQGKVLISWVIHGRCRNSRKGKLKHI
ncbi:UNVERIFIED_CONTAM: hypothetical protein FKN15_048829 [Acipenser sinensis]